MILSGQEIERRVRQGQIFKANTWVSSSIKEASYALRVAPDGLVLEGRQFRPGEEYPGQDLAIEPGKIAILSTIERLDMPVDLVGKIGIRIDHALKGITGLMGIQVDPLYGNDKEDERLFVRVANLGNETVRLRPRDEVFTFELHTVDGRVDAPSPPRRSTWERIEQVLAGQENSSWSYVTRVRDELSEESKGIRDTLNTETQRVRDYLQPIVMFGIFLVAVTILGVALTVILSVRDTPEVQVPSWVTGWAWAVLMSTLVAATLATAAIGFAAACQVIKETFRRKNSGKKNP